MNLKKQEWMQAGPSEAEADADMSPMQISFYLGHNSHSILKERSQKAIRRRTISILLHEVQSCKESMVVIPHEETNLKFNLYSTAHPLHRQLKKGNHILQTSPPVG
ncbi:hypothetical protein [Paenibacillus graminis]|uniref:hypothetical protein n=1 Tax=Paenibacillus graminis TaxID=189425 RepID=UPI0030EDA34E